MSIDRRQFELRPASGISRRDMLSKCSTGFGLVALSSLMSGGKALAAAQANPFAPRVPHLPPKVKSVIFCFYYSSFINFLLKIRHFTSC